MEGGDLAAGSPTATLLRLSPSHEAQIRHGPLNRDPEDRASSEPRLSGLTGGVCKRQGRIHRKIMTCDY